MSANSAVKKSREINMTQGGLFSKILAFSLPLMATGVLQLLFNTADLIVVGSFVGDTAFSSVGATSSLVSLIVNFFIGISMGAGIAMSKAFGAGDKDYASRILHTSVPVAVISGVIIMAVGLLFNEQFLILMDTPENCLPLAKQYLDIYFCGAIFNLLYNFGASCLRAVGDTIRPLIFLLIAGIANVIINLISVIVFKMGVAGVAYATIASQGISCVLVMVTLAKNKGFVKFHFKKIRIHKDAVLVILRLGIPAGLQNSLFSLSNVLIQKTINDFGENAIAGNTAARELEGFVYILMNSVANTAVTAVGQNYGAKNFERIKKAMIECVIIAGAVGIVVGGLILLLNKPLLSLYTEKAESISYALSRMYLILTTYFLCGVMDVLNCSMRGLGCSVVPMVIVLLGTCALRIFWIYVIFPPFPTYFCVLISYPISWFVTSIVGAVAFSIVYKSRKKQFLTEQKLRSAD